MPLPPPSSFEHGADEGYLFPPTASPSPPGSRHPPDQLFALKTSPRAAHHHPQGSKASPKHLLNIPMVKSQPKAPPQHLLPVKPAQAPCTDRSSIWQQHMAAALASAEHVTLSLQQVQGARSPCAKLNLPSPKSAQGPQPSPRSAKCSSPNPPSPKSA